MSRDWIVGSKNDPFSEENLKRKDNPMGSSEKAREIRRSLWNCPCNGGEELCLQCHDFDMKVSQALDLVRSEALEEGLSNMMQAIEICKDLNSLLCRVHIPAQMFHFDSCMICRDINKANEIMDKMQTEWEAIRALKRGESK